MTGPAHTVTNQWEETRDALESKENKAGTTTISKYDYLVNAIGQRTNVTTSGSAFPATPSWAWGYDSLGQVISADSSANTNDRAYEYDAIGNRKKSADSLTLQTDDNYTSNSLNQYSSLSLNSQPATLNDYDDDGNLTSGQIPTGSAGLVWDAENRLIAVSVIGQDTIHYAYDAQSRRISRSVGSLPAEVGNEGWVSPTTSNTMYIYDAWNVIAEYSIQNSTSTIHNSYLWGTDLSGSPQGAGGVGGLLSVKIHDPQSAIYYPTYDGNGNVSEYLAADGSTAAHFEYDPFGNTVVNTDTNNLFAYRFSTKPLDQATGLYYFGYRYYDPVTGRWPSKDPIEEDGGINLYAFVGNDGINWVDLLGMKMLYELGSAPLANLQRIGVTAYTGARGSASIARPHKTGTYDFEKKKENGLCCAKLKEASYLVIDVVTIMASNLVDGQIHQMNGGHWAKRANGASASVKAHEDRRVKAYRDANSAFLEPAEGKGSVVTKCGWVCRDSYDAAEDALLSYVDDLQKEATDQYNTWIAAQQRAIGSEVKDWDHNNFEQVNGQQVRVHIFKGYSTAHSWVAPTATWNSNCPNP